MWFQYLSCYLASERNRMLEPEETLKLTSANPSFQSWGQQIPEEGICSESHSWVDVSAICVRHPVVNLPISGLLLSHKNSGTETSNNLVWTLRVYTVWSAKAPSPGMRNILFTPAAQRWPDPIYPKSCDATWDLPHTYEYVADSHLKQLLK